MFCFPEHPNDLFGVLHPAYSFTPTYSVITKMYRMEYMDDLDDIMTEIDCASGAWVLDTNRTVLQEILDLQLYHFHLSCLIYY